MSIVPVAVLAVVVAVMVAELRVSQRHERQLRAEGAVEPAGDVYRWLRIVYPASFAAMAAEGVFRGGPAPALLAAGVAVLALAKALKFWAVASLGLSWSFRVLVRQARSLVQTGPYRYLKHPNYVAIFGEVVGVALAAAAPITGAVSLVCMAFLLARRIAIEERALGLRA